MVRFSVLSTAAILATALLGSQTANATPLHPLARAASCDPSVLSCTTAGKNAGACCSPTYGLVVLSLQWYKGLGPSDAFTVHGLWPDTCSGGQGPSNGCDANRQYDDIDGLISQYAPEISADMDTYWSSYKGDNNAFHVHEWGKHGTCVTTLAPSCGYTKGKDVAAYFRSALALRSKYNIYAALKSGGVVPGGSYASTKWVDAIKKVFAGYTPQLVCSNGEISEVRLFFKVKGTSEYVPAAAVGKGSCGSTIRYPYK
ncbi:ribonuclease T2 [Ramicandelaber brevisporus]|nr:ribonuclease T2 [Ramicandelaber brevisporus]